MARKAQRWEPTRAACARRDLLILISDGRAYMFGSPEHRRAYYQAVMQLEERGLVRVDRSRRPFRFQIVLPEERWLEGLERWADVEMRQREVRR